MAIWFLFFFMLFISNSSISSIGLFLLQIISLCKPCSIMECILTLCDHCLTQSNGKEAAWLCFMHALCWCHCHLLQEFSQNFLQRGVLNCNISKLHNMFLSLSLTWLENVQKSLPLNRVQQPCKLKKNLFNWISLNKSEAEDSSLPFEEGRQKHEEKQQVLSSSYGGRVRELRNEYKMGMCSMSYQI